MSRVPLALCAAVLVLAGSPGGSRLESLEGTIVAFEPGESLTIANDQTGPRGVRLVLRDTRYEGREAPGSGVRARVWFRSVGERRPTASRVRVVTE